MYYAEELIEDIRRSNDIVDVIGSYVKLQKKGSSHLGLCPFHNEKTPSFSVSGPKQMFYCFGCQKGGNVITFVMDYENYSFPEAIALLADRAGIQLPAIEESEESRKQDSLKKQLMEINREAGKFYYSQLRTERGDFAMNYLKGRGLSDEMIRQFGLGYSVPSRDLLYKYLKNKGYRDDVLSQSGLFNYNERNGMQDKFWSRVIFPYMDAGNKIIAFGGRIMGDGEPKYLNSPETPVFVKGRHLYGLNFARASRKKNLIICEGYMDVISLHQAGFNQAVASLGTALTPAQVSLLKRYSEEVLVCYDSDGAGVKAALKAIEMLRSAEVSCRVINMRPYKDPDEFIKNLGAEEFQKRIDNAENYFYYMIRMAESDYNLSDPEGLTKFHDSIAAKLSRFDNAVERDNYLDGVAKKYGINPDSLRSRVNQMALKRDVPDAYERPKQSHGINKVRESGHVKAQKHLITWLSDDISLFPIVSKYIKADDFDAGVLRNVAIAFYEQLENGEYNPAAIISMFDDEEEQREIAAIFHSTLDHLEKKADEDKALKDIILHLLCDLASTAVKGTNGSVTREDYERLVANKKRYADAQKELASKTLIS